MAQTSLVACGEGAISPPPGLTTQRCLEVGVGDPVHANDSKAKRGNNAKRRAKKDNASNKPAHIAAPYPHLLGARDCTKTWPGEAPDTNAKNGIGEETLSALALKRLQALDSPITSCGLQPPPGLEIDSTSASMCDGSMTKSSSTTDLGSVDSATQLGDRVLVDTDHRQRMQRALPSWLASKPNNKSPECDRQILSRNALREKGQNALAMIQTHACGMHSNGTAMNLDTLRAIGKDVLADVSKRNPKPYPSKKQYAQVASMAQLPQSSIQFESNTPQMWGTVPTWERAMPMRTWTDLHTKVVADSQSPAFTFDSFATSYSEAQNHALFSVEPSSIPEADTSGVSAISEDQVVDNVLYHSSGSLSVKTCTAHTGTPMKIEMTSLMSV